VPGDKDDETCFGVQANLKTGYESTSATTWLKKKADENDLAIKFGW
jgi:hypothetical protein